MASTSIGSTGVTFPDATVQNTAAAPSMRGQVFTYTGSSQTFTIPTGVTALKVTVVGGGAGGGTENSGYVGGGGGGGAAIKYLTNLTPGNTLSVTVGAGGTAGSYGAGGTGGTSSVSSGTQSITTISATGGTSNSYAIGGTGGSGSNGDMNITGQAGSNPGPRTGNAGWDSGAGGSSILGGGGRGASGGAGGAGGAYGGGGGGARNAEGSGGAGAAGVVIFEW